MDKVYKCMIEVLKEQDKEHIEYLKEHKKFFKTNVKAFTPIRSDING
jgi:mannose/fructose/N-acetylgalactosamine-specific phosphotransferase system component IID